MEGKSVIFRTMGGVNAIPLCLDSQDPDEIIRCKDSTTRV
ncbi:hypothetical protein DYY65_08275 [Nitrososphaera sp. AFS]|nr:hypothetical protein [Nitrososphaera sp. AFS]